ncbi:hypothetical protein CSUB01_04775 [Colletotrichum sublineola]|uniref:Uncharacterized protein n=1 Tax=Colletotrichum sublineola TaxID=1173701 RepID=A0A066XJJ1_COLSU|nr:hypothetical protein CSUB01_04775 [Colletotrichum sublineola]
MLNINGLNTGVLAISPGKIGAFFGDDFLEVTLPAPLSTQTSGTKVTMQCQRSSLIYYFNELDSIMKEKGDYFEWRKSNDDNAKTLGKTLHRKLVRKSGPKSGTGNSRTLPQAPSKSDSEEPVASTAYDSRWNPCCTSTFPFEGSGFEGYYW